jgi:hypothetical protein
MPSSRELQVDRALAHCQLTRYRDEWQAPLFGKPVSLHRPGAVGQCDPCPLDVPQQPRVVREQAVEQRQLSTRGLGVTSSVAGLTLLHQECRRSGPRVVSRSSVGERFVLD